MDNGSSREAAAPDTTGTGAGSTDQIGPATRKLIWAGLGALAELSDAANEKFDEFVVRGRQVQTELQDKADDMRRQNAGARGRVQDSFRGAMDVFLNTFNLPSKGDVDTLNMKLNILSRKLDDLQAERVDETSAPQARPPRPRKGPASEA